jgi:SAM-dependent methyltransferase
VRALQERGYRVFGIDAAEGLVRRAHDAGLPAIAGSALSLPFADASLDFVYVVGVLHHLPDIAAQETACLEILRVLRPGGRLVVHETNPRNPLFSFYMGYVFPILKTIDEGTEWWIEPARWERRTDLLHVETRWFTFLPDFIPRVLMPPFRLLERVLENSPLRRLSVHYMAVMEKPVRP